MEKLVRGPVVRRVMRKAFGKEAEVIGRKSNDSMKCDISGSNVTYGECICLWKAISSSKKSGKSLSVTGTSA